MTTFRATVIMKTDISGSTVRFRALGEADLHALLIEHREFLGRHAAAHGGHIVKPEGDGFWLVFPSVTAAALAAMTMQEELRFAQPNKGDQRLAMRVVITLGDVLHEEGALVGDTVVLTTRIEAITPADEIYLSAAAWLAVNQAEVRTAFVDRAPLKGFADPVPVYRVEQTHRTRVVETLFGLTTGGAREFGGTVRFGHGDAYCLTFADATLAMAAAERLSESWDAFVRQEKLPCPLNVAVHRGTLYAFRSYLYGPGLDVAASVERASAEVLRPDEGSVFVTGDVRSGLAGTVCERRLERVDIRSPRLATIPIYRVRP